MQSPPSFPLSLSDEKLSVSDGGGGGRGGGWNVAESIISRNGPESGKEPFVAAVGGSGGGRVVAESSVSRLTSRPPAFAAGVTGDLEGEQDAHDEDEQRESLAKRFSDITGATPSSSSSSSSSSSDGERYHPEVPLSDAWEEGAPGVHHRLGRPEEQWSERPEEWSRRPEEHRSGRSEEHWSEEHRSGRPDKHWSEEHRSGCPDEPWSEEHWSGRPDEHWSEEHWSGCPDEHRSGRPDEQWSEEQRGCPDGQWPGHSDEFRSGHEQDEGFQERRERHLSGRPEHHFNSSRGNWPELNTGRPNEHFVDRREYPVARPDEHRLGWPDDQHTGPFAERRMYRPDEPHPDDRCLGRPDEHGPNHHPDRFYADRPKFSGRPDFTSDEPFPVRRGFACHPGDSERYGDRHGNVEGPYNGWREGRKDRPYLLGTEVK